MIELDDWQEVPAWVIENLKVRSARDLRYIVTGLNGDGLHVTPQEAASIIDALKARAYLNVVEGDTGYLCTPGDQPELLGSGKTGLMYSIDVEGESTVFVFFDHRQRSA